MVKTIVSDFARTLLFPKDPVILLELNQIHKREIANIKNVNVFQLSNEDLQLTEAVYPTSNFFALNYPLLNLYKSYKAKGISLILFSSGFVQTHPDFKNDLSIFDQIVNVYQLGEISKRDSNSYKVLCEKYKLTPSETVFIDNESDCISSAKTENINTIQFPEIKAYSKEQLYEKLMAATKDIETEINKLL